jgi:hypothetical protein
MRKPPRRDGMPPTLVCVDPVPPTKSKDVHMMAHDLITNLVPDLQRFEGERLVTRTMLS